jgi:hypothetical protein
MRRLKSLIGASLLHYGVTNEKAIDILHTEDTEWEVKDKIQRIIKNHSKCTFMCIILEAGQMDEDSEVYG